MARFDFIAAYIMVNRKNGAIYTGSASDLRFRVGEHKSDALSPVHVSGAAAIRNLLRPA